MEFDHYDQGIAYDADSALVYTKILSPLDSDVGWDTGIWDTDLWDATG